MKSSLIFLLPTLHQWASQSALSNILCPPTLDWSEGELPQRAEKKIIACTEQTNKITVYRLE